MADFIPTVVLLYGGLRNFGGINPAARPSLMPLFAAIHKIAVIEETIEMPIDPQQTIYYKRARFTTRLPVSHRYHPAHFWLAEEAPGVWRVGLTKFATRMLGDLVECRLDLASGERLTAGQTLGAIEGFKAVSDIYSVVAGEFAGSNAKLEQDPTLLDRDPYDGGWLYRVRGAPGELVTDVAGYVEHLNKTIDRMLEKVQERPGKSC